MPRTNAVVRALLAVVAGVLLVALGAPPAGATESPAPLGDVRRAVFVGNNWDGTADVHRPAPARSSASARINIIPDIEERMARDHHRPRAARLLPRDPPARSARATTSSSTTCTPPATTAGCWSSPGRASPTSSRIDLQHRRRSSGASASTASAPTTWRSRPTASASRSPPRPATSSTSSTRARARRSAGSPPATRRTRTTTPPTASGSTTPASARLHARRPAARLDTTQGRARFQIVDANTNQIMQADRHGPEARRRPATRT